MTFISPFQLRFGGNTNDSALISSGQLLQRRTSRPRSPAIAGFAGTATVTGAPPDRLHRHVHGRRGQHRRRELLVRRTSTAAAASPRSRRRTTAARIDSFTLNYNGNTSAPIVNGTNYTRGRASWPRSRRSSRPARPSRSPASAAATSAASTTRASRSRFGGTPAATNVPVMLGGDELHAGRVGLRRTSSTRAARSTTRAASSRRPATRSRSSTAPAEYTIPLRTPFALTGSRDRRGRRLRCSTAGSRTTAAARPARRCS